MLKNDLRNYYFRCYGLLLEDIMDNLSVDTDRAEVKQEIHQALKKYFEIESLRDLTTENLYLYIQFIRMIFAREFGILLKKPGEPEDIQNMDMKQFLKYQ